MDLNDYVVMIFMEDGSIDSRVFNNREDAVDFIENKQGASLKGLDAWENDFAEYVLDRG